MSYTILDDKDAGALSQRFPDFEMKLSQLSAYIGVVGYYAGQIPADGQPFNIELPNPPVGTEESKREIVRMYRAWSPGTLGLTVCIEQLNTPDPRRSGYMSLDEALVWATANAPGVTA